jgi:hypothetical protein
LLKNQASVWKAELCKLHQQNLILPIESRQTHRLAIDTGVSIDSHRLVIDTTCLCSTTMKNGA